LIYKGFCANLLNIAKHSIPELYGIMELTHQIRLATVPLASIQDQAHPCIEAGTPS